MPEINHYPPKKSLPCRIWTTEGFAYQSVELGIYAVYPTRKFLSPKVRAFVNFLVERFEGADREAGATPGKHEAESVRRI